MSLYGLTAVRINPNGRILAAVMQRADGATNQWLGTAHEYDASDIASMIYAGNTIYSVFMVDGQNVLGPKIRYVEYPGGDEGCDLEHSEPGRTLAELTQLGPV